MTLLPNFIKIYQAVQKLLVRDPQRDRQPGVLISLLSFLEIRLKANRLLAVEKLEVTFIVFVKL
jgi:hypothetical protein